MTGIPVEMFAGSQGLKASRLGQLSVAPYAYDDVVFKELAADNTAYNFFAPRVGRQFVMTGLVAKADKQVSTSVDAEVVVYEASAGDSTTADKVLFQVAMVEGDFMSLLPLNILVREGVFVNAKTSDDDIHMTIMGYYIPVVPHGDAAFDT